MDDPLARIPLSALRVFEAAARLKSFTRAAEALGMTQAAVSWQVKALEKRLDQALFVRLPREVALTAAGERLARAAGEAMGLLRAALADVTEQAEGVLAITTLPSYAALWLAPRLGEFQLAHPEIAVRLETSGRLVDLHREPFDVAIRSGDGEWPGLETQFLMPSELTPLCTPGFAAAVGGLREPADVVDLPRIGVGEEWAAWFAAAGLAAPQEASPDRLVSDSQVVEVGLALAGRGLALGSPALFAAEIAQGRLLQPFAVTAPFSGGYWLAYPKDRRRSPKISAFRAWILAAAAQA
jgi:LysR family glycine cleavage system transcriptional activator